MQNSEVLAAELRRCGLQTCPKGVLHKPRSVFMFTDHVGLRLGVRVGVHTLLVERRVF
jgi:hypothetical protein